MKRKLWLSALAGLSLISLVNAQSVETYAGTTRAGIDLLWFKKFKTSNSETSNWLFFSRNRASVDYFNSPSLFGSTQAVSYNTKSGFGAVGVGAFSFSGIVPKAGVQYVHAQNDWLFFGWTVIDLKKNRGIDLFGLFRYTPVAFGSYKYFFQTEVFFSQKLSEATNSITNRTRLGLKKGQFSAGFMGDVSKAIELSTNFGVFLRTDF